MLWVALFFPTLALDRIQRRLPDAQALPLAVVETAGNRRLIQRANASAQACGVQAAQPLATALALCPSLAVFEHDPLDEEAAVREAALAALRFTPYVSVRPQGLLLEAAASLRLFGGPRRLLSLLKTDIEALGLSPSYGCAPHARAAWLLARATQKGHLRRVQKAELEARIDALPLEKLEEAEAHLATLKGLGCASIGDVRRLPRAGLARRFGVALIEALSQAYGTTEPYLNWIEAPERFCVRVELLARAESTAALVFVVRRLMVQLGGWLAARHTAVSTLTLILHHEAWRHASSFDTPIEMRLAEPCRDPEHLLGLLRERLERLSLPAPVEELTVSAADFSAAVVHNQELFPTVQSAALTLNRLMEKIRARLGSEAVVQCHAHPDHRPDRAWRHSADSRPRPGVRQTTAAARPTWLCDPPEPLPLRDHRPCHGSPLALLAGPERIEAGWWDDAPVARDYYIAENQTGQLLWIFRERRPSEAADAWFLHGLFA